MADRGTALSRWQDWLLALLLSSLDLAWNLTHLNIGLVDFHGLADFARGLAVNGAWPATPYFPAGYPLLLMPFGYFGQWMGIGGVLPGGFILAAVGEVLALWALQRLCRLLGLSPALAALAALLGWLAPELRVTAGSPSVDLLYTGLGAWFITAALAAWRAEKGTWLTLGCSLAPALLLLIRYHAWVLVVPVALVLLFRPAARRNAILALACSAAVACFNHASYQLAWDKPLPSVAGLQVRGGLDFRYQRLYPTPDALYADYPNFIVHVRSTPLLSDFSAREITQHVVGNWIMFLRRPAVAAALALALLAGLSRQRLPAELRLGLAWVCAYTLALSPAYYTARAASLPSLIAIALLTVLAAALAARLGRFGAAVTAVSLLLFLAASLLAARFAIADWRERAAVADLNRRLTSWLSSRDYQISEVFSLDGRLTQLERNPWLQTFKYVNACWLQDPDISPLQLPDVHVAGRDFDPVFDAPLVVDSGLRNGRVSEQLRSAPQFRRTDLGGGLSAYERLDDPPAISGASE